MGINGRTRPGVRIPLNDMVGHHVGGRHHHDRRRAVAKKVDSGTGVTRNTVSVPASISSRTRKAPAHRR